MNRLGLSKSTRTTSSSYNSSEKPRLSLGLARRMLKYWRNNATTTAPTVPIALKRLATSEIASIVPLLTEVPIGAHRRPGRQLEPPHPDASIRQRAVIDHCGPFYSRAA